MSEDRQAITIVQPVVPSITQITAIELLVQRAVKSGLAKTKRPEDAFFIAMYGLELGVPVMTALRTIYSVGGGAPTCSGELMLALIRRSQKVQVRISSNEDTLRNKKATVYMKRLDSGDEFTASWGPEDDNRAGLRSNRDKYPAQMWTWRAVSIAAKALCSDIVGGLYTVEEIYPDTPLDENGEPVGEIIDGSAVVVEREAVPQIAATAVEPEAPAEQQSTGWASDEHLRRISGWWTAKGVQWTDIEDDMKALGVNGPFDRDGMNKAFAEGRIAYQTGLDIFDRKMAATPPATTREKKPDPAEPARDADDLEAFFAAPVAEVLAQTSAALTSPAKDDPAENGQKTDKPGNGTYITKNGEKPNWQPSQLERMAGVCQMVYLPNKDVPASQADVMFVLGVTDWKDYPKMDDALEAIRSHILTGDFATLITAVTRKKYHTTFRTTVQNSIPFQWDVYGFRGEMEKFVKPAGEPGVSQRFMDWARARLEKNGHYIFGQQEPPMPDLVVTLKKDGNAIVIGRMMELADVPF